MTNNSLHGLIILNKPSGISSHAAVKRVKRILKVHKAGHTGTLDPFATGVLTVCVNEGTKLVPFLMNEEKEYEASLYLGIETDTQDLTGRVIKENKPVTVTSAEIERVFQKFQGTVTQIPPMYSALKRNGVPLYRLARQGKEIERPERQVEIRKLSILDIKLPQVFFRVICSKGTYVRTLASDLGKSLGCGACLEMLRRIRSGNFSLKNSLELNRLEEKSLEEIKERWFISLTHALSALPAVEVDEEIARNVQQGKLITRRDLQERGILFPPNLRGKIRILNPQGGMIAIAETANSVKGEQEENWGTPMWKLLRVFNVG